MTMSDYLSFMAEAIKEAKKGALVQFCCTKYRLLLLEKT